MTCGIQNRGLVLHRIEIYLPRGAGCDDPRGFTTLKACEVSGDLKARQWAAQETTMVQDYGVGIASDTAR